MHRHFYTSACALLVASYWPKQVTWPKPESLWEKGPLIGEELRQPGLQSPPWDWNKEVIMEVMGLSNLGVWDSFPFGLETSGQSLRRASRRLHLLAHGEGWYLSR